MMNSEQIQRISDALAPALETFNGYIVDIALRGERGNSIVQAFIDTDEGVTADQCASVSRHLSAELDRLNLIKGRYRIEVSSPGLDRPLRLTRQFMKNIGRHLKIAQRTGNERKELSGVLKEVSTDSLSILTEKGEAVRIPFGEVVEATVVPQFKGH